MCTKKIYRDSILFVYLLLLVTACKKLDLAPSDRFTELTFWQSDINVNNFLSNVYNGIYSPDRYFYNEAMSDNAHTKLGINTSADAIASGNFTISLPRFQRDWNHYFSGIKSSNIFLENVDKNTTLSEAVKNRMKGEARFIRAWHHFNLMKWWGDVPLLTKDISPDEAKLVSRTPRAEVLQFVLDELDAAAAALPANTQYEAKDRGRITKSAALALKARVLLYEGNKMSDVVTICEQLINNQSANGTHALANSYTDLFSTESVNKNSNESIFALQHVPVQRTWSENIDFVPISIGARTNNLSPTQELVNDYIMLNGKAINEAGSGYDEANPYANRDPRLRATIVYDRYNWNEGGSTAQTIYIKPGSTPTGQSAANEYSAAGQGTSTGYYIRKFWDPSNPPGFNSGLNLHLIRYAEVLLMYAEAKNALGQMTADVWNKTIRALRQRAGFTNAAALDFPTTGNMTEIIRRERRVELALEGMRIDDIRRWKISETVLNGWAHGAKFGDPSVDNGYIRVQIRTFDPGKHYLWPVPPNERALNTNLSQNNGYEQ
jgi:starch-binding outer membrane protein, SusD/RagB family